MCQARELCNRTGPDHLGRQRPLFTPEEMVTCLQDSQMPAHKKDQLIPRGVPVRTPGSVSVSWILEARSHPKLCRWLEEEMGWMLNPQDVDRVAEAAEKIREDEEQGGGAIPTLMDVSAPGLRYRLQTVPVCGTCVCIYAVIHEVVTMIHVQNRGSWAKREKIRRKKQEEHQRERQRKEVLAELMATKRIETDFSSSQKMSAARARRSNRSLVLDPHMQDWLHRLDAAEVESPRPISAGSASPSSRISSSRASRRAKTWSTTPIAA